VARSWTFADWLVVSPARENGPGDADELVGERDRQRGAVARYEQHLAAGHPLPPETTAYVAAVTPLLGTEQVRCAAFST